MKAGGGNKKLKKLDLRGNRIAFQTGGGHAGAPCYSANLCTYVLGADDMYNLDEFYRLK